MRALAAKQKSQTISLNWRGAMICDTNISEILQQNRVAAIRFTDT
jgi:hypothetical protein